MPNLYKALQEILQPQRVQIGQIDALDGASAIVQLPGGGKMRAKMPSDSLSVVGATVFVRGDAIQGAAPSLPVFIDLIEA